MCVFSLNTLLPAILSVFGMKYLLIFLLSPLKIQRYYYSYKPDYKPIFNFSKSLASLTAEFFAYNLYDEIEHSNSFKLMSPEERYQYFIANKA